MEQELVIDSHGIALTTNIDCKLEKSKIKFRFISTRLLQLDILKKFSSSCFQTNVYISTSCYVIPAVLFRPRQFLTILIYDLMVCR